VLRGNSPYKYLAFHERYGDVVRIAPDELAFSNPDAWKQIMGTHPGDDEFEKWRHFYRSISIAPVSIINGDRAEHSVLRRQLSPGFSERSLREQEPLIKQYIDLLMLRLHENCAVGSKSVDMVAWYNFTTFDIIGDLTFGRPFGSLENSKYNPFIPMLLKSSHLCGVLFCMSFVPYLQEMTLALMPKSILKGFQRHREISIAKLNERMRLGRERNDLIEGLLGRNDELVSPASENLELPLTQE
jgi:cytochrome P450